MRYEAKGKELYIELKRDKTVIFVTHRLSTVKNADQIVVLSNGVIVEIGNHEELAEKRGIYP